MIVCGIFSVVTVHQRLPWQYRLGISGWTCFGGAGLTLLNSAGLLVPFQIRPATTADIVIPCVMGVAAHVLYECSETPTDECKKGERCQACVQRIPFM